MRVYFAREKNDLTTNTYTTSNHFFLFLHTPTHACARNSRTTLCFKTRKSLYQTNSHVGIPNPASYQSKRDFWTLSPPFQSEAQFEKPRSSYYYLRSILYVDGTPGKRGRNNRKPIIPVYSTAGGQGRPKGGAHHKIIYSSGCKPKNPKQRLCDTTPYTHSRTGGAVFRIDGIKP
jgi:hypothetical protein